MLFNINPAANANITKDTRSAKVPAPVPVTSTGSIALAANTNRANYSIYNEGPATVFIGEGSVVTPSLYEVQIPAGFYWKEEFNSARYLGEIAAITESGTASLLVSEGSLI